MAKRTRRKRSLPPTAGDVHNKPPKDDDVLHDSQFQTGFDPPNHMLSVERITPAGVVVASMHRLRWPLSQALTPRDDAGKTGPVFVDASHMAEEYTAWADAPPTWMDPHLLIDLALQDPDVMAEMSRAFRDNKRKGPTEKLQQLLCKVFEEQYLQLVIERFWGYASHISAEWMLLNYAERKLAAGQIKKRRKLTEPLLQDADEASNESSELV